MTLRRYTKSEVDAALHDTERGSITPLAQHVLAGEVLALRVQYRSTARCHVHNARMFVPAGSEDGRLVCWRCTEGLRLQLRVSELVDQLGAATLCPSGSLVRDEHGRMQCRYRPTKQEQVQALQATNDRLRNELAQMRVEFHFLLEGREPAVGENEHD